MLKMEEAAIQQRESLPLPSDHKESRCTMGSRIRSMLKRIGRGFKRISSSVTRLSFPRGPGHSDKKRSEQVINVLTCLPLILLGVNMQSQSQGIGRSITWLGVAAALYHSSPTKGNTQIRVWARKADYWAIAASSCQIHREVKSGGGHQSPFLSSLMSLLVLHSPTLITLINYTTVEFQIRSRPGFLKHALTLLAAGLAFKFEKLLFAVKMPRLTGIAHGMWHLLAARSLQTAIPLKGLPGSHTV